MVAAGVWIACLIVAVAFYVSFPVVDTVGWVLRPQVILLILGTSLGLSVLYWFSSQIGARGRLLRALHCKPLDPGDRYHQRLANIVEEMRLATGAPRIECRTVPTLGLNAFAFSDLRGAGVIGVTEGALSRLSRQQLEAVVAHEFAHVLSGNYVTVTVSCLLFGVYSALGEELEGAMMATASTRAAPVAFGALFLRGWLWVLQLASSITTAALSRERERHADLAAVRYTRDPLSLAEALRIISRHPGGAGSIPEGLAPLCIRQTGEPRGRLLGLRRDTHPPIGERIDALLALAHVSPSEFERQIDEAGEHFDEREHWAAPPAAEGGPRRGLGELLPGRVRAGRPGRRAAPAAQAPVASLLAPPRPGRADAASCPVCGHSLEPADYEGMLLLVCRGCGGRLGSGGADQAHRRPPRGGLHVRPAAPGRRAGGQRRPAAPRRTSGPRQDGRGSHPLPAVRQGDDARPLRLRACRGGRQVLHLRPRLVREGRARGPADPDGTGDRLRRAAAASLGATVGATRPSAERTGRLSRAHRLHLAAFATRAVLRRP